MNQLLADTGYRLAPGFLSAAKAQALAGKLEQHHATVAHASDEQVPNAPVSYNFLPFVRLMVDKTPEIAQLCGAPVLPTYAYSRKYPHGAVLARHCDRDACEISVSLHLRGDHPWSLWFQGFGQAPANVDLVPGDAVLYLGCQYPHWRETYPGQSYMQVFLHYVLADGPRAWAFFDREQRR